VTAAEHLAEAQRLVATEATSDLSANRIALAMLHVELARVAAEYPWLVEQATR